MRACVIGLVFATAVLPVQSAHGQVRDARERAASSAREISGVVVSDDAGGRPIGNASVTIQAASGAKRIEVTDGAGRFSFSQLSAGRYLLSASKLGYLAANYGASRPGRPGTAITIESAGLATDHLIVLVKGSAIEGLVTDATGEPAQEVRAVAYRYALSSQTGERVFQQVGASQPTDDQGHYRIFGLEPGRYLVSASWTGSPSLESNLRIRVTTDSDIQRAEQIISGRQLANVASSRASSAVGDSVAFAPVYYPSAFVASEASFVEIRPREDRTGVNIQLRLAPTTTVKGVTSGPDGVPLAGVSLTILDPGPKAPNVLAAGLGSTQSDQGGHFTFRGVSPGSYTVIAGVVQGSSMLWGSADIAASGGELATSMSLQPGVSVSGRIVLEGASPPMFSSIRPILVPTLSVPARSSPPVVSPDGTFTFASVAPGSYRLVINGGPPRGWAVQSMIVDGQDALDSPLIVREGVGLRGITITFTDQPTRLSGRMLDASGGPAPEYFLIAYAVDRRFWVPFSQRVRSVRPGVDGHFSVVGLPPGDYLISVLSDIIEGEWYDPQFLEGLSSQNPIKITLAPGESKVQDIQAKAAGFLFLLR